MGVKHLWDIIDETKSKETLDYLRGRIVTVDLSIWIVEAIKTLQFKTSILKPHLRNMFYRILALRKLGIKLLFVTEGQAPELKQNAMKKRNEIRYGVKSKTKTRVGRSQFQNTIKECCRLLDLLGMPHVKAAGEAEAMCAVLNLHGYTDGCLTNDGDFFLYGGQTIYRDFGIDPKDPHVFVYDIETIKKRLHINRNDMIGLALLCGCDYTNGVAGVGKGLVTNFLEERCFTEDLLSRFHKWYTKDLSTLEDLTKSEKMIARKAVKSENSLSQQIIDEYLVNKDVLNNVKEKLKWEYPSIKGLQEFLYAKMEWPFEYTLSKVMQLASSAYLQKISDNVFYPVLISPIHIVKTRSQHGVALVEINWEKDVSQVYNVDIKWDNCPDSFTTLENHQVILKLLPDLVETYLQLKESKKSVKTKKKEAKTRGVKSTEQCNVHLVSGVTEDVTTSNLLTNGYQDKSKIEDVCSSPCESQEYDGNRISRDFLADVICEDIRDFSLHHLEQVTENTCNGEDNSESDKLNVLSLFQRLHSKTLTKNINNVIDKEILVYEDQNIAEKLTSLETTNGSERCSQLKLNKSYIKQKTVCPGILPKSSLSKSIEMRDVFGTSILDGLSSQVLQGEHINENDGITSDCSDQKYLGEPLVNSINFPNLNIKSIAENTSDDLKTMRQKYSTPPQRDKKCLSDLPDVSLVENTPLCFQSETPKLLTNTPKLIRSNLPLTLSSSTPLCKEPNRPSLDRSPLLRDITNFSNLGDSILGHSMDLFDDCGETESCKEPKTDANIITNTKPNKSDCGESILCDSLDLCEQSILISGFGDSILCRSLDLAVCDTSDNKYKPIKGICDHIETGKVSTPKVPKNYEDLLREKFEISLTCDDVSMRSISICSNNSSRGSNNFSMVEGSPLCLADRLKIGCTR